MFVPLPANRALRQLPRFGQGSLKVDLVADNRHVLSVLHDIIPVQHEDGPLADAPVGIMYAVVVGKLHVAMRTQRFRIFDAFAAAEPAQREGQVHADRQDDRIAKIRRLLG